MRGVAEPMIVALVGLPLAGKTTLAERLAEQVQFCYLSVDVIRKALEPDRLGPPRRKSEAYEKAIMLAAYTRNHDLARSHLLSGTSVILDATYSRPEYHTMLIELARATGARLLIFHVIADADVVASRIQVRPPDALSNIRTMSEYTDVARRYVLIDYPTMITVDTTTLPIASAVSQIRNAIYSTHEKESRFLAES